MKTTCSITPISGVFEIKSDSFIDDRGVFTNSYRFQDDTYKDSWAYRDIKQINVSLRHTIGNICGLHIQHSKKGEAKLIRCLQGRVWDVAVDLRQSSETYGRWHNIELSPSKGNAILIPEGCAHGFQVIENNSQLLYIHSEEWFPENETGIRWDDPTLDIQWPLPLTIVSERDLNLPYLK